MYKNNSMHEKGTSLLLRNVANPDPESSVFLIHGSGSGMEKNPDPEAGKNISIIFLKT
jgi:hypothetical protein